MKKLMMIAIAIILSSCASMNQDNRSVDRILKVCAYNTLVNWMGSGSNSTIVQGDVAKALDATAKYRIFEGVCYENQETIQEEL